MISSFVKMYPGLLMSRRKRRNSRLVRLISSPVASLAERRAGSSVSFWGVDWSQVLAYFNQLAVVAPYLSDSSFLTSLNRQATAQYELYSQYLVTAGYRMTQGKYCEAFDLYNEASLYVVLDANQLANFETARNQCLGIQPTEEPQATTEP